MYHNNSIIYRINPKFKIVALILVASLSFLFYDWYFYLITLFITFFLYYIAGIPYCALIWQIRPVSYSFIIILIIYAVFYELPEGLKIVTRFTVLILFSSLLMLTTRTSVMIDALESFLKPLSCIGVDPSKCSLALSLTIRFIPLIIKIFNEVRIAQNVRGLEKNLIATSIPIILNIFRMADNIAEAIEARS